MQSSQATNGIFQRTTTNNFTVYMEIQKTSNSQSNIKKEEWNWTSDYTTKLQSSREYGTGTKYHRSMDQNKKSRDKPMHPWTPYL